MGQILLLNDIYPFEIPESVPGDEKLILNFDKKIEDQYWTRPPEPRDFANWGKVKQQAWIEKETEKCFITGEWIFIKGEPVWLPPDYYWTLRWWFTDDGYFKLRRAQLLESYFWNFADADPTCIGTVQFKKRRDGLTTRRMARMVWKALQTPDAWFGIQSKTGKDAKKVCWSILMRGFKKLPSFFLPEMSGNTDPKTMLEFKKPSTRITNTNKDDIFGNQVFAETEESEDLNTTIDWRDSTSDAYDGQKTAEIDLDEFAKWEKANALDAMYTYIKSCSVDGRKIGMLNMFSSPTEKDSDAHKRATEIWDAADYKKRAKTDSFLLYRWFTSSLDSWAPAIDKYGDCDRELARRLIEAERNAAAESKKKAVMRQTAMNIEEVFESVDGSIFNTAGEMRKRKKYLENIQFKDIEKTQPKWIFGNYRWHNDTPDTHVYFKPADDQEDFSNDGRWQIAWQPPKGTPNFMRGKMKKKIMQYTPSIDSQHVLGIDPYDFRRTDSAKPSLGAGVMGQCFDHHNVGGLNRINGVYNYRPRTPEEFYEDQILWCVACDAYAQVESNKQKVIDYFEDRGYFNVLLPKDMDDARKQDIKGTPTTAGVIQQMCTLVEGFTATDLNEIWNEIILTSTLGLNPANTKESDVFMAFAEMLIGFTKRRRFYKPKKKVEGIDTIGHAIANNLF